MKPFLVCLFLSFSVVTHAEEAVHAFVFPPFAKEDIKLPIHPLPDHPSYEELNAISVEEWRGIMSTAGIPDQFTAAKELMTREDQKTILRLVYSLKQGNVAAEEMLTESKSLTAIPYLMEDVGHGSLEYYGTFFAGDAGFGEGRVRVAAVKLVASILANAPEFTGETRDCLKAISSGRESEIQMLSEESRYLIQWWLLNQSAFEAGKWEDTRPGPQEITYTVTKEYTPVPRDVRWSPESQPPFGSPAWEIAEPFEAWAERIVDPKRRNLDFVALSWDGKKVVEHPAKSLDPKAKPQDRESHKTPAPRNPPESESEADVVGRKRIIWITVASVLVVVLSIVRWLRRKSAANANHSLASTRKP